MSIITAFLDALSIKYNNATVERFLKVNPDHPSILSFSELLDEFRIPNAGVKVEKQNFPQIPVPFICKTASSEGDFVMVKSLSEKSITYLNEKDVWMTRPLNEFFMQYQGAVLVGEPDGNSGEPDYQKTRLLRIARKGAILLLVACLLFVAAMGLITYARQTTISTGYLLIFLFFQLLGLGVSALLLMQSLNLNNAFINNLCSSASGNGCKNLLSSDAANVPLLGISWSETGFIFFLTNIICLALVNDGIIHLLTLVSVAAMGYPVYSVYYQYFIAKIWCRLCLAVQVVLLSSGLVTAFALWKSSFFSFPDIRSVMIYAAVVMVLAVIWSLLKPLMISGVKIDKLTRDVNLFKKNETIFWNLLKDQRSVEPIEESAEILLGNPGAAFEITFVSNPFCKPCKNMHTSLNGFLASEREKVRLKIVFTPTFKINDVTNNVIRKLIEIYLHDGAAGFETAFADWYERGIQHPEKWISDYGHSTGRFYEANELMLRHRDWCDEFDITHTPAVFYNNHLYLSQYSLDDLKWFLSESPEKETIADVAYQ